MKHRYRFHPSGYALGESEQFYSGMEAKGWRLVKRGWFLSKFAPVRPSRTRYRIEVASPGLMEDGSPLPPEQLGVYEDCGWEYAAGRNPIHIFRAPEGSEAPEFYADPAEQAETLKSLRAQAFNGAMPFLTVLILNLFFFGPRRNIQGNLGVWHRWFIEETAFYLFFALLILGTWYIGLRNFWLINGTYPRLKNGVPLDHDPRKRHLAHKAVCTVFLLLLAVSGGLAVMQKAGTWEGDLPAEADGPYLLLRDLGYDLERRVPETWRTAESSLKRTSSLLADYWDVYEVVEENDSSGWMYEDIYRLRSPKLSKRLVEALKNSTTFGEDPQDCSVYVMPDLIAWVYRDLEIVAVSGNMAAHITWMGGDWTDPQPEPLLEALRARWEEYGIASDGKTGEQPIPPKRSRPLSRPISPA